MSCVKEEKIICRTLNKLALVPIMKPAWSKPVTQPVLLGGVPLLK